jgi:hypothetical protein
MLLIGCESSTPTPTTTPSNVSTEPEPSCKTAVERASSAVKLRAKDVTMAIGECDQNAWTRPARDCVGAAHTNAALVACSTTYSLGKSGIFADTMSMEKAIQAMEHFRDQMCACKDTQCAQRVSDDMAKWSQDMAKRMEDPPQMSEEETKRATEIGESMGKCMQTAMSAP